MGLIAETYLPSFRILANTADITAAVRDRLVSLSLTDEAGLSSDILEIVLADNDPAKPLVLPSTGAELELFLGYGDNAQRMGMFVCDELELAGWPGELTIRARAAPYDTTPAGKTNLQTQKTRSWPKGTKLGDLVAKIAADHGMEPAVSGTLKTIVLPHIDQADESDVNFLARLGKRYDAVVKPAGGKLVLAKRGETKTISGEALPVVTVNASECSSWRMTTSRRETAGMVVAYWHAVKQARRHEIKVGSGEPVRRIKQYFPTEEMALAAARAELARRERGAVTLALSLPGRTDIIAEAPLSLAGFRDGLPASWIITRVRHRLDVGTGYAVELEAEQPNEPEAPNVEIVTS